MVELQIINKILKEHSDGILTLNNVTDDYFVEYVDEYRWLKEHRDEYGNIADIESFLDKFPDFEVLNVNESNEYLINTFREEYLFRKSTPIFEHFADLYQTDSFKAVDYIKAQLPNLKVERAVKGTDIISQAQERYDEYEETKANKDKYFLPTGFAELDEVIGGLHKGEELMVLFARTGQGKSWVMIKMLEHLWKVCKARVGLLEPEMSANKTGYRFDTLHKNISNKDLIRGNDIQGYERYIKNLQSEEVPFFVAHPKDFSRQVTVSKLRSWCEVNKLDILAIDGISYLMDERAQRGDSKTNQLTNISEDLMQLSIDLQIPVVVVVQSNRLGGKDEEPELENIRDSDGISYNASIVMSIQQKDVGLVLAMKKFRNGSNNIKLTYLWDIDVGKFEYMPSDDSGINDEEQAEQLRRRYDDDEEEY